MINKIEINDIPGRRIGHNNTVINEVEQFHNSDWDACEVDVKKYANVKSAVMAYRQAISVSHANVIAVVRGDRLFLVRGNKK